MRRTEEDDEDVKPLFCRKPPVGPTESEKREHEVHEVTHMPFRSWCPACVQARAADWPAQGTSGQRASVS